MTTNHVRLTVVAPWGVPWPTPCPVGILSDICQIHVTWASDGEISQICDGEISRIYHTIDLWLDAFEKYAGSAWRRACFRCANH